MKKQLATLVYVMKKLFDIILYLGLLAGGLQFTLQAIQDCLNRSTDYSARKEPLTLEDLPTLTFCFPPGSFKDDDSNFTHDFLTELKTIENDEANFAVILLFRILPR